MLTLIAAQSIDGFIARHDQPGTAFCSDADTAFLRDALTDFDSLIMGRKTFDTLRQRILSSPTTRYLRKIITRDPAAHAADTQTNLVEFTSDSPTEILAELAQRGRHKTALLGGGEIYTQYLAAKRVDELWITLEPHLFGSGTRLTTQALDLSFQLHTSAQLAPNTLLLKYRPIR